MKILGINDEVTTCECCGRSNLKRTVVLSTDAGEVRYGTECAARAMKCDKATVTRTVNKLAQVAAKEAARQAQIRANHEAAEYDAWLLATYGDTRSDMTRRKAWRAAVAVS